MVLVLEHQVLKSCLQHIDICLIHLYKIFTILFFTSTPKDDQNTKSYFTINSINILFQNL